MSEANKQRSQGLGSESQTQPKFTPGPWRIRNARFGRGNELHDIAIVCEDGTIIAEAFFQTGIAQYQPAEANARLIAAAPEMYGLLDELDEFLDNYVDVIDGDEESGPRPNKAMRLQQELRELIAKAEGRSL